MLLSSHYVVLIVAMTFAGMATSGRLIVGFIYTSELFTPKWKVAFATSFTLSQSLTGLSITIFFDYVSKHSSYLIVAGIVMTA